MLISLAFRILFLNWFGSLCTDHRKQEELIDAYNADLHGKVYNKNAVIMRAGKGRVKAVDHAENSAAKYAFVNSILDQVRKQQTNRNPFDLVLSKDGYRNAKDKLLLSIIVDDSWS